MIKALQGFMLLFLLFFISFNGMASIPSCEEVLKRESQFPLAELKPLVERYKSTQDSKTFTLILKSYHRFIRGTALTAYRRNPWVDLMDYIQEGNLALLITLNAPQWAGDVNIFHFHNYAMLAIRGAIKQALLRNGRAKFSFAGQSSVTNFLNKYEITKRELQKEGQPFDDESVAKKLKIKPETLHKRLEAQRSQRLKIKPSKNSMRVDSSFDDMEEEFGDASQGEENIEQNRQVQEIVEILKDANEKKHITNLQLNIVYLYLIEDLTQEEIANQLGYSSSWIQVKLNKILEKLQDIYFKGKKDVLQEIRSYNLHELRREESIKSALDFINRKVFHRFLGSFYRENPQELSLLTRNFILDCLSIPLSLDQNTKYLWKQMQFLKLQDAVNSHQFLMKKNLERLLRFHFRTHTMFHVVEFFNLIKYFKSTINIYGPQSPLLPQDQEIIEYFIGTATLVAEDDLNVAK